MKPIIPLNGAGFTPTKLLLSSLYRKDAGTLRVIGGLTRKIKRLSIRNVVKKLFGRELNEINDPFLVLFLELVRKKDSRIMEMLKNLHPYGGIHVEEAHDEIVIINWEKDNGDKPNTEAA